MASTIFAECRTSRRTVVRGMAIAGTACLVAFSAIPFVMTGIVGPSALGNDPATVFLVPANAVLGKAGATVTSLMLACALIVGAQAFIISSSRTLYQMARDGYMPLMFRRVNRFGVPFNTIICDAAVIALLVGIFGTDVINLVASANVGYLLVFVILPVGFVIIRKRGIRLGEALVMPGWMTSVALVFMGLNLVLLVVGAALWGIKTWLTGLIVLAFIFPLMVIRNKEEKRMARSGAAGRNSDIN